MFAPTHMVESSGCSVNVGLGTISTVAVLEVTSHPWPPACVITQ